MATRIKICGITSVNDATQAAASGADFLGFVFYPKSTRFVSPECARDIVTAIADQFPSVKPVAVVVDESLEVLLDLVKRTGIRFLQLHGAESADLSSLLREHGLTVIKAFRFGAGAPPARWQDYSADYFLCDTFNPNVAGGTGCGWQLDALPSGFPLHRSFIAGGLRPETVGAIVRRLKPFGVDVSSGVEAMPGRKNPDLVQAFVNEVRLADKNPFDARLSPPTKSESKDRR